jgi:hypothetical protein
MAQVMLGSPTFHFIYQMVIGRKQGLSMVYGMIQSQPWLLASNDAYRLPAVCVLLCAPWPLLLRARALQRMS